MLINKKNQLLKISYDIKKTSSTSMPFDHLTISFIQEIYKELKKIKFSNEISDLAALTFWLRTQNINKILNLYNKNYQNRFALGVAFHISPSNTPINFFYSYIFGIITGNINIVRIPSKKFISTEILLKIIFKILKNKKFNHIKGQTYFINYKKDSEFTEFFSSICNVRIIWGGDETVNKIRKIPISPKSREITFSDKYSCTLINADKVIKLKKKEIFRFVQNFFNDGFFVDQNACSSPHLIFWHGRNIKKARNILWENLELYAKKEYDLPEIGAMDKFTKYCEDILKLKISNKIKLNNYSYNIYLKTLPKDASSLRGKWGYFYEYKIKKIKDINDIINHKFQTLTYFGFNANDIVRDIGNNSYGAIDRVVPLGYAHSMDQYWDGYDMINSLTRVINNY